MKTAISLPESLFRNAEQMAQRLGLSRSELYATALAEYLAKHRGKSVTEILNDVYGADAAESELDQRLQQAQLRSLQNEDGR